MNVEIITIGDELLIGQVIDTNSSWMARELNKIGLDVKYKTTIGDEEQDILDAFEKAFSRSSIVLVTGGIGPTKDDITKKTLCKFFDTKLIFDENTIKTVEKVVKSINRSMNDLTYAQAYVPESATIIQNEMGTAPVTWFEKEGKILVSMPGVPYEMKWIMTNEIIPRLEKHFSISGTILHQSFWLKNYSESMLAMELEDFENNLPNEIKLAYLPSSGLIRLRLTGKAEDKKSLEEAMRLQKKKLLDIVEKNLISIEDKDLQLILHEELTRRGLTLGIAESCTGGAIAALLTAIPGSSKYFKGGVVSYSNEAKTDILNVSESDLINHGAVSCEVVEGMVNGAQAIFKADCAIATSGIAGPDGGTEEKPVGTVWIAVKNKNTLYSECFQFTKNREANIQRATNKAMQLLLERL
ncbi:competence/damage-inducible protein A [Bacteroidales bacterium OttesenSCG-928-I14]|nr:competence/damage-inducible protein A [Bacteroidales bacterium OttesenSCG-928-I14]